MAYSPSFINRASWTNCETRLQGRVNSFSVTISLIMSPQLSDREVFIQCGRRNCVLEAHGWQDWQTQWTLAQYLATHDQVHFVCVILRKLTYKYNQMCIKNCNCPGIGIDKVSLSSSLKFSIWSLINSPTFLKHLRINCSNNVGVDETLFVLTKRKDTLRIFAAPQMLFHGERAHLVAQFAY